jgi:hypothetical protein
MATRRQGLTPRVHVRPPYMLYFGPAPFPRHSPPCCVLEERQCQLAEHRWSFVSDLPSHTDGLELQAQDASRTVSSLLGSVATRTELWTDRDDHSFHRQGGP